MSIQIATYKDLSWYICECREGRRERKREGGREGGIKREREEWSGVGGREGEREGARENGCSVCSQQRKNGAIPLITEHATSPYMYSRSVHMTVHVHTAYSIQCMCKVRRSYSICKDLWPVRGASGPGAMVTVLKVFPAKQVLQLPSSILLSVIMKSSPNNHKTHAQNAQQYRA